MSARLRLVFAGALLVGLIGAAVAVDAWARGPGLRGARRPAPRPPLVEARPTLARRYAPTAPLARGAGAARVLLGLALAAGVALHLRRGEPVRPVASAAALLAAAWALATGVERLVRAVDLNYLRVTVGAQSGGFTLDDVYLALAVVLAAAAGLAAALRRAG